MAKLTGLPSWKNLESHFQSIKNEQLRDLFIKDNSRFDKFNIQFKDILIDYSKNRITEDTLKLLLDLAKETGVKAGMLVISCGPLSSVLPFLPWNKRRAF